MSDSNFKEMGKCKKCMDGSPYPWCCKYECYRHEECEKCHAECKGYRLDFENCS